MKTYEDGLNEAWEAIKKIMCIVGSGMTLEERGKIFGDTFATTIVENYTAAEAITKITEYEKPIGVGDEVESHSGLGVVLESDEESTTVMKADGGVFITYNKTVLKKTGRHFPQIEELLQKMQEGRENGNEDN